METRTSQGTQKKEFWDRKARTFPRFAEGEDTYEAGILNKVRSHGVDFNGSTVLDVGCGSGMYTIRLAREAARVTALDISDEMLNILRKDAENPASRQHRLCALGVDGFRQRRHL